MYKRQHETLGVTIVYVTHDQGEALTMSNRIAVFNDGHIQQLSSPNELYERPTNSFVARFIGENNIINGTIIESDSRQCKVKTNNGETIHANPVISNNIGDATSMSLRPERVLINPSEEIPNKFKAKIEEVIYHGDHTRLRASLLDQSDFILKVPNASNTFSFENGSEVLLGWDSQDCRALDFIGN